MGDRNAPLLVAGAQRDEEGNNAEIIIDNLLNWDPIQFDMFEEHKAEVWSCAISVDNQAIFSGSNNGRILEWHPENNQSFEYNGHQKTVIALILTKDNQYLISVSKDKNICIWDLNTRQLFRRIEGNSEEIYAAALSNCGRFLATCGKGPNLDLWNVGEWTSRTINIESQVSYSVIFNQTAKYMIVSCSAGVVKIFYLNEDNPKKMIQTEAANGDEITCMAITSNDDLLFVGYNTTSQIKTFKEWKHVDTFQNFKKTIRGIVVSNDDKYLIAYSADQSIKIFDINTRSHQYTIDGCEGFIYSGCLSSDNTVFVCTSSDGVVRKLNLGDRTRVDIKEMHKNRILAMDISEDHHMATGGEDYLNNGNKKLYIIKLLDLENQDNIRNLTEHTGRIRALKFSSNQTLASASDDRTIKIWTYDQLESVSTFTCRNFTIYCLDFSLDSRSLIAGSKEGNIIILDTQNGQEMHNWIAHNDSIFTIQVVNPNYVVSGSADYNVKIWNQETEELLNKIRSSDNEIISMAFNSPDKQVALIAFGYKNGEIEIFEWSNDPQNTPMKTVARYQKHHDSVQALAFFDNNSFLISGSCDKTIRVFNISEEMEEYSLTSKISMPRKIFFRSQTQEIISADLSGKVYFWNIRDLDERNALADFRNPIDTYLFKCFIKKCEKINPNHVYYKYGNSRVNLAHIYACLGQEKLLISALRAGTELKRDIYGNSPLHYALLRNHQECVDAILKYSHELQMIDFKRFLLYMTQLRHDFDMLIQNHSAFLPDFLDDVFYKTSFKNRLFVPKQDLPIRAYSDSSTFNFDDHFINNQNANIRKSYQVLTLPFAIPSELGSETSLKFLTSIQNCPNQRILQTKVIQTYIKHKWNELRLGIWMHTGLIFLNNVLMILIIICNRFLSEFALDPIFFLIPFIVLNVLDLIYESFQIARGSEYLESCWNILDLLRLFMSLTWAVLSFFYSYSESFLSVLSFFTVMFNMMRGLTCFRIFDNMRYYVRLITHAIKDSRQFILIFFYSTISFGVLYITSTDKETELSSILIAPHELNLGTMDKIIQHGGVLTYGYFFLASVINVIIMLNLLISILGDIFDSVQLNATQMDYLEMAEIVYEIETFMFWKRRNNSHKYLHLCEEITAKEDGRWNGKVRTVVDLVKKMKTETSSKLVKIEQKIDQGIRDINSKFETIHQRLNEINNRNN